MLTPSPSPAITLELRRLLDTDYAVPPLWDDDKQALLDNDAWLYARVLELAEGGVIAGSITDAAIGVRGILDTHVPPPSAAYDDTLTNHLRTLATRIRAIMGTSTWANPVPTTLATLHSHTLSAGLGVHGATRDATATAIVARDIGGRARFGAPEHPQDAARKDDVDNVRALLSSHTHDDRYYTKSQLAASGGYGTNQVHADRVSVGTLQEGRIPNLNASKITAGTLADARLPAIRAPSTYFFSFQSLPITTRLIMLRFAAGIASPTGPNLPGGWTMTRVSGGTMRFTHGLGHTSYLVLATTGHPQIPAGTWSSAPAYSVATSSFFDVITPGNDETTTCVVNVLVFIYA